MTAAILRRLKTSAAADFLAKFDGEAAIFYHKSPSDVDFHGENYPQVVFTVDKFSDAIRGVSGLLTVDIICSQDSTTPEIIERPLRESLEGVFFAPVDGEIFLLKWQRTDVFQEPSSERTPLIIGATVTFEIYEFPSAQTCDPDPIQKLNLWASTWDTNAVTIGLSDFGETFKPSRDKPAIYFDAQRIRLSSQTAAAVFLTITVNAHVFADSVSARREWLSALNLAILRRSTFLLEDSSPMRLTASELNFEATEIQGQLQLTFEFAAQKFIPYTHPLTKLFDGRSTHVQT